jgi:hypothetical protein
VNPVATGKYAVDAARYRHRRVRRTVMRDFLENFSLRERRKQKKKHAIAGRAFTCFSDRDLFPSAAATNSRVSAVALVL